MAGGTFLVLVAVLHAASVIRCGGCASGAVRCITQNASARTHHTVTHTQHPTPDDASRMQYSHKTRATSPGPGPIVCWPTSGAPLGSQSLLVVAALRPAGWSPEAGQWAI